MGSGGGGEAMSASRSRRVISRCLRLLTTEASSSPNGLSSRSEGMGMFQHASTAIRPASASGSTSHSQEGRSSTSGRGAGVTRARASAAESTFGLFFLRMRGGGEGEGGAMPSSDGAALTLSPSPVSESEVEVERLKRGRFPSLDGPAGPAIRDWMATLFLEILPKDPFQGLGAAAGMLRGVENWKSP